ncbi:MAG: gliding motility-associated C-terminal domain-containing protein, partial [Chitinophagales bacterium]|nr:gliding motility-associated C-terminal domain-containing protein [Chitinophagales bacterium]
SSTTSGVTYQWSGPGILNGGSTPNPTVNMAGTYTLTVTQTSTGCANTDIVVVTGTTTPPNASAGLDKILDCSHPTVVLDGSSTTSGVTYQWSGPGILNGGSTPNPTVNMAGTYTLTVTQTSTGCANTDIVVVAESISSLLLTATIQHNNCGTLNIGAIDVTMIGGTPPFKYLWSNGATTEDVSSLPDDVYKLNVIDGVGCDFDTIFSINSSNGLVVKAFTDTVIKMGLPVSLFGSIIMGSPRYIWWEPTTYLSCINCQNPVSFPIEDIDYVFHAVDSNGCEGADTIHIKVEDDIHSIFFPTAFSPDGNNINDQFKALGEQKNIQSFNMRIFNRWGERIFESDDIKIGWDGKYQQEKQEMDIYIYQTEIIYTNQSVSHLSGAFLLLR